MSYVLRRVGTPLQTTKSSSSASTPSTVVYISQKLPPSSAVDTNPAGSEAKGEHAADKSPSKKDFLRAENRVLPLTSNFLINRHKLLRKTDEGKTVDEGGILTGSRNLIAVTPTTLTQNNSQLVDANAELDANENSANISSLNVRINKKSDEISGIDEAIPQVAVGNEPVNERQTSPSRQISSVRWSPLNRRPQVPPKPQHIAESKSTPSPSASPTKSESSKKTGRSVLRVPSLRGPRSRTPSRGPSEERAKKKEEFLEESVMYTKVKPAPPEPPLSGNRHHLLRGRQANITRVEVSPPQLMNSTMTPTGTTIQIGGPRAPSPSPQRTTIIPASIQNPTKMQVVVDPLPVSTGPLQSVPVPVHIGTNEPQITPVYTKLSEARTMVKTSTRTQNNQMSSGASTSSFIQPNIRPMPPRKPLRRTEMTDTLLEVLPHTTKRQAPLAPPNGTTESFHERTLRTETVIPVRQTDVHTGLGAVTINVNQLASHDIPIQLQPSNLHPSPSSSYPHDTPPTPSFGGQLNFEDEFESNFSSSHFDYDPSSTEENDDLVRRTLVKASRRRGPNIEDIQEETVITPVIESNARKTIIDQSRSDQVKNRLFPDRNKTEQKPAYDRPPQRSAGGAKVVRNSSFVVSSADDSDSSRGPSYIASTRPSRKVEEERTLTERADSAGRRKYVERRQLQRNFEIDLQKKGNGNVGSSADSDADRDARTGLGRNPYAFRQNNAVHEAQKTATLTRSNFLDRESDDGGSISIGVPEPLPEYDYPNRIQGRTIKEEQQIRETVNLRPSSLSSSSSSDDRSPTRRPENRLQSRHHFSRHFEMSPEEMQTARSLIHHRLPPNYSEPPQPIMGQSPSRSDERNRTPPPTRPLQMARHQSQSPRRPPHLPPQSPINMMPVVHSDGEGRYYPEKPKKKMGIVRRLSELVRGERKSKRNEPTITRVRNTSSSSGELENLPEPIPAAGTLSVRRQSPVRRYQDQPLRPSLPPTGSNPQVQRIERNQSFTRPTPTPKLTPNRNSGNFSDHTAASFAYLEPAPVYAQPNKLQKQQNMRHRSMSEYDLHHGPPPESRSTFQYEDPHPIKPSKSIESITESVYKQKYRGSPFGEGKAYKESTQRVTKTHMIPYGKKDFHQGPIRNTAYVRSGIYDKNAQHYSSTPLLTSGGVPINYRMAPPQKPPRRYDFDSAARSSDSDPHSHDSVRLEERIRVPAERPLERARPEMDLRAVAPRAEPYSDPAGPPGRTSAASEDIYNRARSPIRSRFQTHVTEGKRATEALVPEMKPTPTVQRTHTMRSGTGDVNLVPAYARTRIAANDYNNRRYHSAAADINQIPVNEPGRKVGRESRPSEPVDRQYKSSYRLQMEVPPGGMVAERSKFFNNPSARREFVGKR